MGCGPALNLQWPVHKWLRKSLNVSILLMIKLSESGEIASAKNTQPLAYKRISKKLNKHGCHKSEIFLWPSLRQHKICTRILC